MVCNHPDIRRHIPSALGSALLIASVAVLTGCVLQPPAGTDGAPAGPQAGEEPADPDGPLGAAQAASSSATIRQAEVTAHVYFSEYGAFGEFTPELAEQYDPNLSWNESPTAVDGEVSIRGADETRVLLVTTSQLGDPVCAAIDESLTVTTTLGSQDAPTFDSCSGGLPGL
ncbi:MAG: hypothetical protein WD004_05195 [Actinomycetota bacterium]